MTMNRKLPLKSLTDMSLANVTQMQGVIRSRSVSSSQVELCGKSLVKGEGEGCGFECKSRKQTKCLTRKHSAFRIVTE